MPSAGLDLHTVRPSVRVCVCVCVCACLQLKVDKMYIAGSLLVTLAFVLVSVSGARNSDPVGNVLKGCWQVSMRTWRVTKRRLAR